MDAGAGTPTAVDTLGTGTAARPRFAPPSLKQLRSGLLLGGVATVVILWSVLVPLGGLSYYRTPLSVRAYSPAHRLLRPSGPAGQMFGVAGGLLMLVPFLYVARKRIPQLKHVGTAAWWLEVHLFCGIVGPVLVTFHTSFKFNGIVSAAYWSMVIVMLSGFVGRFLYVRIPRSIRGVELTRADLEARAGELREELASTVAAAVLRRIDAFERTIQPAQVSFMDLALGEFSLGRRTRAFARQLADADMDAELRRSVVSLSIERAVLLRRSAYLQKTKALFGLWHVFHLPLVYLMLFIVTAHVAVALYLGYIPFRW